MTAVLDRPVADTDTNEELGESCQVTQVEIVLGTVKSKKTCDKRAVWSGRFPCCGREFIVCHDHRYTHSGAMFSCSHCRKHHETLLNWTRIDL